LLPLRGGIGFFLHEQLRDHLVVVEHHGNPPNTLWAVGDRGDADANGRF
jgi:hypothetical protein